MFDENSLNGSMSVYGSEPWGCAGTTSYIPTTWRRHDGDDGENAIPTWVSRCGIKGDEHGELADLQS